MRTVVKWTVRACLQTHQALWQVQCPGFLLAIAMLGVLLNSQPSLSQVSLAEDTIELPLRQFRPKSQLRVPQHLLQRARFPVVDVHTHFELKLLNGREGLTEFVKVMDQHNIAVCVSLDGKLGEAWRDHEQFLWQDFKHRFVIFAFIDWRGSGRADRPRTWSCNQPEFVRLTVEQIREAKRRGASGMKVFKSLGLEVPNPDGTLARIDDPRWDPIWRACGDLQLPVLIHAADPAAFFEPVDATNERWEELKRHPEWSFYGPPFPRRQELLEALLHVVKRHPRTTFIAAHMANYAEDLGQLSTWLDTYPNLFVDIASRIAELGRQPRTARKFFIRYADRILFGTDGPWPPQRLQSYWRFLETEDEYFPYSEKEFPPQGFWQIYGIALPESVLRQVYYENAARLVPGVKERLLRTDPESPSGLPPNSAAPAG